MFSPRHLKCLTWKIVALLCVGSVPALALDAGITFEAHQDIVDPDLWPNDFHVEGLICSDNGIVPNLVMHIDGPFTNFSWSIVPAGLSDPCWYKFTADWWLPAGSVGIPYCTVIHLGLLFDVEAENVVIDLRGWWTLNGQPVGEIPGIPPLGNDGNVPLIGFDVEDWPVPPEGQVIRIGNGGVIAPPTPAPIPIEILQMDLVPFAPGELEAVLGPDWFNQLYAGGPQENLPWIPVQDGNGNVINPGNPLPMPPDSFFDVFIEIPQPDQPRPEMPFSIPPGGHLLARQLVLFMNNDFQFESRWFWEIHGAQEPEACCFPDGTCQDLFPVDCFNQNGTPMGMGTACAFIDCPVFDEACCLPDGSCAMMTQDVCRSMGGFPPPGGLCLGDWNGNGVDDACEEPQGDYRFEFSIDIGSDTELSDPYADGDEGFDPGDVYWWQGPPVTPPQVPGGRDGFKDDQLIFGFDILPDPPDPANPPATRVPVGQGGMDQYWEYFDLDGHDQLDVPLIEFGLHGQPLDMPVPMWDSLCIHWPEFLMVSFDDDMGPGWPAFDVPVTAPSPAGVLAYGTTQGRDEIIGVTLGPPPMLPSPIVSVYPIADEITVHMSLRPNPDTADGTDDDDVDSLDIVPGQEPICQFWYFSPDHEATGIDPINGGPLDPGDIYLVMPGSGPMVVVDDVYNLGIPDETDVDAFEFTWFEEPGMGPVLAVLFSVDDDDPITPWDESGGLDPRMIYVSFLIGFSFEATEEPLPDDIDALTIWRESLEVQQPCPGDMDCDGDVDFDDINPFVLALGGPAGYYAQYPNCIWLNGDCDGDGDVDFDDINAFVALIGTTCP